MRRLTGTSEALAYQRMTQLEPYEALTTSRIQLSRAKGWRMPARAKKVDRSTRWGNPYRVDVFGLARSLALFENTLRGVWMPALVDGDQDALLREAYALHQAFLKRHQHHALENIRHELGGWDLACWCKLPVNGEPDLCHAEVLLKFARGPG